MIQVSNIRVNVSGINVLRFTGFPGDGVWVKYAEISEVSKETVNGEEKSKTRVLNRLVKVLRFMNAAPKGLQSAGEYLGAEVE